MTNVNAQIIVIYLNYVQLTFIIYFILLAGYQIHSPAFYYQYFKDNNVKHVVRLNSKRTYDAKCTFVAAANIQHTDLVFTDGTPPTDSILNIFLNLCEQYVNDDSDAINRNKNITNKTNTSKCGGAVAVHCKGKCDSNANHVL